ncbi:uracil-DNA glycosylase family protein [Bacteroides caecigallinarum]|uniref:uracil-DNA glycosylase family protein n=1 Tax=Bacteroides caecigallinarum TaxID=1411144 RepID=UPI001F334798|nr:uracil-DNA glycosylase family protein [Bacteroides caecigallinarum]MCF2592894.1 uracil-DNA glycosylase family protein [Bacteroides caecigallinarum]
MNTPKDIEQHPLEPYLPPNASVLMLGSFPPQRKRWSMDFFYPNLQNDMWRIFGHIFFNNKEHFLTENKKAFDKARLEEFLTQKGIALYDTATAVIRLQDNASDKFLEVVEPTDIELLLKQIPKCKAIITTGQKATDIICEYFSVKQPSIGNKTNISFHDRNLFLYRMPSSSRAYPLKLEKKSELYAQVFRELHI